VVFVQGIKTELSLADDQETFPSIRSRLVGAGFLRATRNNPEVGAACADPFDNDGDGVPNDNKLDRSLSQLETLLREFTVENPNTRLVVVGHSQGGLLALQSLQWAGKLPLDAVITLDGAVGGTPHFETGVAANFSCWGDPAARELNKLWKSTKDHVAQGTTAAFASKKMPNTRLVTLARSTGTRVMTIGSSDDCVFNPGQCSLPGADNTSTQVVETANIAATLSLGQNCAFACVVESHSEVLRNPEVLNAIEIFVGNPILP
jgi:hypothetical protein